MRGFWWGIVLYVQHILVCHALMYSLWNIGLSSSLLRTYLACKRMCSQLFTLLAFGLVICEFCIMLDYAVPKSLWPLFAISFHSTACFKLEEYQTAKAALEKGASLAPGDTRFTNLLKECDQCIAGALLPLRALDLLVTDKAVLLLATVGCSECYLDWISFGRKRNSYENYYVTEFVA